MDTTTVKPFDLADYRANPGKYQAFKTARVAETVESAPGLDAGRVVAVDFHSARVNAGRGGAVMPIYGVRTAKDERGEHVDAFLFACALGDFML